MNNQETQGTTNQPDSGFGSSHCYVVVNIAFRNDRGTLDNWYKTCQMQRVPAKGERIWILEQDDYTVTDVWWCIEKGTVTIRCVDGAVEDDWIFNLKEAGFDQK